MALNETQIDYIEMVLAAYMESSPGQLSDWEVGYMADQQTRFEEYGERMMLSAKQWKFVVKVGEVLDVETPAELKEMIEGI